MVSGLTMAAEFTQLFCLEIRDTLKPFLLEHIVIFSVTVLV